MQDRNFGLSSIINVSLGLGLYGTVYIMAFNDCFFFVGCALLLSGRAIVFLKKVQPGGGAAVH